MDECEPLHGGEARGGGIRGDDVAAAGRGVHSFTLALNLSNSMTHS